MRTLIKDMVPRCSIYDMNFRDLVDAHYPGPRDDLSRKVGLIFVDSFYIEWSDRNNGNVEYDLFRSKDIKDMAIFRRFDEAKSSCTRFFRG